MRLLKEIDMSASDIRLVLKPMFSLVEDSYHSYFKKRAPLIGTLPIGQLNAMSIAVPTLFVRK